MSFLKFNKKYKEKTFAKNTAAFKADIQEVIEKLNNQPGASKAIMALEKVITELEKSNFKQAAAENAEQADTEIRDKIDLIMSVAQNQDVQLGIIEAGASDLVKLIGKRENTVKREIKAEELPLEARLKQAKIEVENTERELIELDGKKFTAAREAIDCGMRYGRDSIQFESKNQKFLELAGEEKQKKGVRLRKLQALNQLVLAVQSHISHEEMDKFLRIAGLTEQDILNFQREQADLEAWDEKLKATDEALEVSTYSGFTANVGAHSSTVELDQYWEGKTGRDVDNAISGLAKNSNNTAELDEFWKKRSTTDY